MGKVYISVNGERELNRCSLGGGVVCYMERLRYSCNIYKNVEEEKLGDFRMNLLYYR